MSEADPQCGKGAKPRGGRPRHDWEGLFTEWVQSGLSKAEFLRLKGFTYQSGTVAVNTREWITRLRTAAVSLTDRYVKAVGHQRVVAHVGVVADEPPMAGGVPDPEGLVDPWGQVSRWRTEQAVADWTLAAEVRDHATYLLEGGLERRVETNPDGSHVEVVGVTLAPQELRQLSQALTLVQRVQRLALGLSTENAETPPEVDTRVEREAEEPLVSFIVETASGRRFGSRARS